MTKNDPGQFSLFTDSIEADNARMQTTTGGAKLFDPRDGEYKVSSNPALILRDLYLRNHDGDIKTIELIDKYICEQADIADQYLFIPIGKGSYIAF